MWSASCSFAILCFLNNMLFGAVVVHSKCKLMTAERKFPLFDSCTKDRVTPAFSKTHSLFNLRTARKCYDFAPLKLQCLLKRLRKHIRSIYYFFSVYSEKYDLSILVEWKGERSLLFLFLNAFNIAVNIFCLPSRWLLATNKYECTTDQELADTTAYAPGGCCMCTHQLAALICL